MGFPRRFLHESEDIVLDIRPHLWYFVPAALAVAGAAVVGTVLAQNVNPGSGAVNGAVTWFAVALVVAALVWSAVRYLTWSTTHFVVTTDRLIHRWGILAKRGKEIPLERVHDIAFNQTLFERFIGSGDLMIESGGEEGQQRFRDIRRPFFVQSEIYRAVDASAARDLDRVAGRRELSVPEQLEKLDELRQRGVVTQAEFDAKKAQLLDRI